MADKLIEKEVKGKNTLAVIKAIYGSIHGEKLKRMQRSIESN